MIIVSIISAVLCVFFPFVIAIIGIIAAVIASR